ncbi:Mur ligase domain-containing protein [Candidatus Saccharibacteria bacterium]|nr:Mur ligase domain-containing protein [Candidatus Saccharibacteria bacterium]
MNIFISGIGGAGMGPLAAVAHQIGHHVVGSDKRASSYIDYLKKHGISDIQIGQTKENIARVHAENPIDWLVYSSAVTLENPDPPELQFARDHGIRVSKRDELLNFILDDKKLEMIAIAGTHGKTTATAMMVFLLQELRQPISYLLPAKTSFADMGKYDPESRWFIYEADEFDRNFLAFHPLVSLVTGVAYDHHEIFPTRDDYRSAFREFIGQSKQTFIWQNDFDDLSLNETEQIRVLDPNEPQIDQMRLIGHYNRLDAWLVAQAVHDITGEPLDKLVEILEKFPGLSRRMEQIAANLYSDYAHTPEKIVGAMSVAREMAAETGQKLVVIYEPLTNRRQTYFLDNYKGVFQGADQLYWLPSYLAREPEDLRIIPPAELIEHLDGETRAIAEPAEMNDSLREKINEHLHRGDLVVAMTGGGGNSLDTWLRQNFSENSQ